MKKMLPFALIITVLLVFQISVSAEAPVASTEFYEAYKGIKMVQRAQILNVMELEIAEYLSSPDNTIDEKAAVINALSWKFEGNNNTEFYDYMLVYKRYRR
ncbi:MAG: hypothetical protein MRJ65_10530 [Candidatus Brocadiaceae bacterium]|nr:hypothetical protein [Candidatus Brocadiaceae bacterium]